MRNHLCLFFTVIVTSWVVSANAQSPHVKASEWVASVDWESRTEVVVEMVESGAELLFSPNQLTFEAGQPYVLRLNNSESNSLKHYFAPDETNDFFQAIATRKVQTSDAEYKAPYFKAVELLVGGSLEIFFVPVLPGTYDFLCTIEGHADAGMTGQITIVGGVGFELDLEVDANFDPALLADDRLSGSHPVWATAQELDLQMVENSDGSLAFDPAELSLERDSGYKLRLFSPATNVEKHYYTAPEFYRTVVTRKAEDSQAEIKVPYFNAVELLIGGHTELFLVPTEGGEFEVICTIPGHHDRGMHGTISVVTSTLRENVDVPKGFQLWANYPNPFNPSTRISFTLPQRADVTLTVMDVLGIQVRELSSGMHPAGTYEISFDASGLPSGVYFYRLAAGDLSQTKAMTLTK